MERVTRIELVSTDWQPVVIAIILYPRVFDDLKSEDNDSSPRLNRQIVFDYTSLTEVVPSTFVPCTSSDFAGAEPSAGLAVAASGARVAL